MHAFYVSLFGLSVSQLIKNTAKFIEIEIITNYLDVLCASQEHLPSTDLGGIVLLHQRRFEYIRKALHNVGKIIVDPGLK